MAYDDIADNRSNPIKGKIFNKPGNPGVDVYEGCKIDYKGKTVTTKNLFKVLAGDKENATGPVLKTDENSKIFFYFADHGAPGLVAMPSGEYLYADKLNKALKEMHTNKQYKEMVTYFEACEGGSMFDNGKLPEDINIFATTATNGKVSSWGTYCGMDAKVNGKNINSCLGDLYSVNWMEDTDKLSKLSAETIQEQYEHVKKSTTKSPVQEFGDMSIGKEPLSDFMAGAQTTTVKSTDSKDWAVNYMVGRYGYKPKRASTTVDDELKERSSVSSRDNTFSYLSTVVLNEPTEENYNALKEHLEHRSRLDSIMKKLFPVHLEAQNNGTLPPVTDFDCYRDLIDHFEVKCGKFSDYSLKYAGLLAAECSQSTNEDIKAEITNICL